MKRGTSLGQRCFLAAVRHCPDWLLHVLNGGRKTIAGCTLDPRIRLIEKALASRANAELPTVPESRLAAEKLHQMFAPDRESGIDVRDVILQPQADRPLRLRIYRPADEGSSASCIVYAHFGGGVVGSLETCDWFCSLLAKRTRADVISVDYRLAPEHRFPAGFDDVLYAYRWARDAAVRGEKSYRAVAVAGDSIGGAFAAAVAVACVRLNECPPDLQLLIYPALDLSRPYPSQELFKESFPLDAATVAWFMQQYLPGKVDVSDPRISPGLHASDGAQSTALIAVAGHDVLADQATAYADALLGANGQVKVLHFENLCHGFTVLARLSPAARDACEQIANAAAGHLQLASASRCDGREAAPT